MAESATKNARRLTDWIILVFVLVVMGLLIADLGSNVMSLISRDRGAAVGATATTGNEPKIPTSRGEP